MSYTKIIKTLQNELQNRVNVYKEYNIRFLFILNITELKAAQIYDATEKLRAIYNTDIKNSSGEQSN